jgi:hypothetical protein
MLHVTNGSVVVTRLHDLGLPGRMLPWDDVLHEGPVRAGLDRAGLRRERAAFLAGPDTSAEIEHDLAERDQVLAAASPDDEVVLWFEHDLYDQLHLLQILDQLDHPRVTAVLADDYLGAQPADRLREWFAARRPVTARDREVARRAWAAFRSADPMDLVALIQDRPIGVSVHLLPALRRHLQQFPWTGSGLSRSEAQALAAVAGGAARVRDAFVAANHRVEEATFMGDSAWWNHIRPLIEAPRPLLDVRGPRPASWFDPAWWYDDATAPRLALTGDGEAVRGGRADHIALNGIDRWLGGVHLTPRSLWRWDPSKDSLVSG